MRHRRTPLVVALIAAGLLSAAMAPDARAADQRVVDTLLEQARYWQTRGRADLTADAWQKLLLVDPDNAEALLGLARIETDAGRADAARTWLSRLRKAHPNHPGLPAVEQSMATGAVDRTQLERARRLSQAGNYEEAATVYRGLFGNTRPAGDLALEYNLTLGGTQSGWDDGRRNLEQLTREFPNNGQYALAYGQVLTYREHTRRQGIRQLAALAKRPDVGTRAIESWRRAIGWLDIAPGDAPLLKEYLAAQPDDAYMAQRLADLSRPAGGPGPFVDPSRDFAQERRDRTVVAGFNALERGQLDVAQANFQRVLDERAQDTNARGGMGIVRLRQGRYKDAQALLEQASRDGNDTRWRQALTSATYWSTVEDARFARRNVDTTTARVMLQRAIGLDPKETVAEVELADILMEEGNAGPAEQMYRQVLARDPRSGPSMRGLYTSLVAQGRAEEALVIAGRLPADELQKVGGMSNVQVQALRNRARRAEAGGDLSGARTALQEAYALDATHPWVQFDLARLAMVQGRAAEARAMVDRMRQPGVASADALFAAALLSNELGEPAQALQTLERVPQRERTAEMGHLQRRLWIASQQASFARGLQAGDRGAAASLAAQLEAAAGNDPELMLTAASAHADLGDHQRALALTRIAGARLPATGIGARMQQAALLFRTGQDAECAAVMQQLYAQPLSPAQRADLDGLRVAYVLRQADAHRAAGQPQQARALIAPLAAERPNDVRVIGALARADDAAGDRGQALARYRQVLQADPGNLDARIGAINAALAANDLAWARPAVKSALEAAPRDPRVLAAAGRLARADNEPAAAADYFRQAIDAERAQGAPRADAGPAPLDAMALIPAALTTRGQEATKLIDFRYRDLDGGFAGQTKQAGGSAGGALVPTQWPQATAPQPFAAPQVVTTPSTAFPALPGVPAGVTPIVIYVVAPSAGQGAPIVAPAPSPMTPQAPIMAAAPAPFLPVPSVTPGAGAPVAAPPPPTASSPAFIPPPAGAPATPVPAVVAQVPGSSVAADVQRELAELESGRGSSIAAGLMLRNRRGDAGRSELVETGLPIEARWGVGYQSHLVARITPTTLDAGAVELGSRASAIRFGSNALAPATATGSVAQRDSGVGLGIGYEGRALAADIGTTPIGFAVRNTVGGIRLQGPAGAPGQVFGEVARRAVIDSLLSFAGTRDDRTGRTWGGVVTTGGKVGFNWNERGTGLYTHVAYDRLTGDEVERNTRVGAAAGVYMRVLDRGTDSVTVGADVSWMRYDKNLRHFSLGHGGYFSPQGYTAVTLPVDWSGRNGRLSYQARAGLGFQTFREDDAAWFPTDAALQSAVTAAAATDPNLQSRYAGQSRTGSLYMFMGALEYQLAPQLFVGSQLGFDNARDYRQWAGGLYVKYAFGPGGAQLAVPPRPVRLHAWQ